MVDRRDLAAKVRSIHETLDFARASRGHGESDYSAWTVGTRRCVMQRPENWPSPSEVEAVKRMGGGCRLVAECYEWLRSCFDEPTLALTDQGFDMKTFGVRVLAASFAEFLGDAPNFVEVDVMPEGGPWLTVTVCRKTGNLPIDVWRGRALKAEAKLKGEPYPKVVRCEKCGGCTEGGHERDGSDLCWCSHSEPEPEVQSEA